MAEKKAETEKKIETEKKVSIRLPLIPGRPKLEYVSVNNRNMFVPRGQTVEVPECIYEVLMNAEQARDEAMLRREKLQAEAQRAAKKAEIEA